MSEYGNQILDLMRQVEECEGLREYQRRVDEDFKAPLPEFVRRLRNYVLHYRLPLATMTVHLDKPAELLLKIGQLREWTGWTPFSIGVSRHPRRP